MPDPECMIHRIRTEAGAVATPQLNPEYIIDSEGHRKAVILSIEEYEELLEDLNDLAVLAERRDRPTLGHSEVVSELKRDGLLPD
jgi:hypothetical protein